jgi:rRNA-processing protein FCF1
MSSPIGKLSELHIASRTGLHGVRARHIQRHRIPQHDIPSMDAVLHHLLEDTKATMTTDDAELNQKAFALDVAVGNARFEIIGENDAMSRGIGRLG